MICVALLGERSLAPALLRTTLTSSWSQNADVDCCQVQVSARGIATAAKDDDDDDDDDHDDDHDNDDDDDVDGDGGEEELAEEVDKKIPLAWI